MWSKKPSAKPLFPQCRWQGREGQADKLKWKIEQGKLEVQGGAAQPTCFRNY